LLAPIAARVERAAPVIFVQLEDIHYNEGARAAIQEHPFRVISADQFGKVVSGNALVVLCNDWAPSGLTDLIARARSVGAITVGLVEGCRFAMPHRYQHVDHVFALGPSSIGLYKQPTYVVGSPLVEAAAWEEKFCLIPRFAAINYKFTYDALDERDQWLSAAILACKQAGIAYALSRHPSDRHVDTKHSFQPINDLLQGAAVLITRSSTVIYEALARYKTVILFPTAAEKLFEFADPQDAFLIAYDEESLLKSIKDALHTNEGRMTAGQNFLHRHIKIGKRGEAVLLIATRLIELGQDQPSTGH